MIWKVVKGLIITHLFVQVPMMIGFHYAAELIGMQMMSPLPPLYVDRPARRVWSTRPDS